MGLGIAIAVDGVADDALASATQVEVYERMGEAVKYRIQYTLENIEGDFPQLAESKLGPGSQLSIVVPVDGIPQYLVTGPVMKQQIHFEHGSGGSVFEVHGMDSTVKMDRESKTAIWADLTDSQAVEQILGIYFPTQDVEATSAGHLENKHALVQRDTDLRFVRRLAKRNGFQFWVDVDAAGMETAHFRRTRLTGDPEAEIVINLAHPSARGLDLSWDVERPTSVVGTQLDLNTKSDLTGDVPQTPETLLGDQSLLAITGDTRSAHLSAPADDAGDLKARGEGALIESQWFIRATCQTSVHALGKLIRAHTVVNLRGIGARHSGTYLVRAVRHTIDQNAHKMDVELVRNGWNG